MSPEIWNLLHDATLRAVAGQLPGILRLEIEADYLRSRFAESGTGFVMILTGCRRFEFQPWAFDSQPVSDLLEIAQLKLWLLSADSAADGCCQVHCSTDGGGGVLRICASEALLTLENGTVVTLETLAGVANGYWTAFEADGEP